MVRTFTSVAAACEAGLRGHRELMLVVQEFLVPLAVLGPAFALRLGGARLVELWLDAATQADVPLEEYTEHVLCEAIERFSTAFLDRANLVIPVDSPVWTRVVHEAVRQGRRHALELLLEKMPCVDAPRAMDLAVQKGNLPLLEWLQQHRFGRPLTRNALTLAVQSGSVEVAQRVAASGQVGKLEPSDIWLAPRRLNLPMIQWIFETYPVDGRMIEYAIGAALHCNHDEIAEYVIDWVDAGDERSKDNYHVYRLYDLFAKGEMTKLKWLQYHGLLSKRIYWISIIEYAKTNGQVEVLEFLEAALSPELSADLKSFSSENAQGGSFEVAKWAMARGKIDLTPSCLHAAAVHGHINLVRWYEPRIADLYHHSTPNEVVVAAAYHGSLDCIQFLVVMLGGKVTPQAIVSASTAGHVEVVKWLMDHCDDPFELETPATCAAAGGFLDVVQFLHTKGCADMKRAIVHAARNAHLNVVEWLLTHTRPARIHVDAAIYEAAQGGHLRVLRLLPWSSVCDPTMLADTARANGHAHVAKWIECFRSITPCRRRV